MLPICNSKELINLSTKRRRQVPVVDADTYIAPTYVEDAETLRHDPIELGRRMARSSMAKFAGHPSKHDLAVSPAHIIETLSGLDAFVTAETVEDVLAAKILSSL